MKAGLGDAERQLNRDIRSPAMTRCSTKLKQLFFGAG